MGEGVLKGAGDRGIKMSWVNRLCFLGNVGLFGALVWLITVRGVPLHPTEGWDYKDVVSVLLTVVTVVLTFIGLVVALAAIWGWQTISQGAAREAAKASASQTDDHLQSETFKAGLKLLVIEQIENMKKSSVQDDVVVDVRGQGTPSLDIAALADTEGDEVWKDD